MYVWYTGTSCAFCLLCNIDYTVVHRNGAALFSTVTLAFQDNANCDMISDWGFVWEVLTEICYPVLTEFCLIGRLYLLQNAAMKLLSPLRVFRQHCFSYPFSPGVWTPPPPLRRSESFLFWWGRSEPVNPSWKIISRHHNPHQLVVSLTEYEFVDFMTFIKSYHVICCLHVSVGLADNTVPSALATTTTTTTQPPPSPLSARQHLSYGDCLEVNREYYQNCSVLDCATQCS